MICPNCNSFNVHVVETICGEDIEHVYRRRKCRECNTKFQTIEIVIGDRSSYRKSFTEACYFKIHGRAKKESE